MGLQVAVAPGEASFMPSDAVAAIDCGTNSTRLLVAAGDGTTLDRRMTITRLGAGVDDRHALAADAIERTVEVLRGYRAVMDGFGATRVRITATSAARDAANREDFFASAAEVVGAAPELLGGEEEARLSFAGATAELDAGTGPWLVADIGGGSTELAVGPAAGAGRRPTEVRSLDMGCVRVTERFLHHDPPYPEEIEAARSFVGGTLDEAIAARPAFASAALVVGLAGTVAAAASLDQGLAGYDRAAVHHYRLGASAVSALVDELSALDAGARRERPGMEEARAGVIVGGLIVLDELLVRVGATTCLTSESDILDGLVQTILAT